MYLNNNTCLMLLEPHERWKAEWKAEGTPESPLTSSSPSVNTETSVSTTTSSAEAEGSKDIVTPCE